MTSLTSQVQRLVALGYPKRLDMTVEAFEAAVRPLRAHAPRAWADVDIDDGRIKVVLVVSTPKLPVRVTLPLVERDGHGAIERLYPKKSEDFHPIPAAPVPAGEAYLLLDVDRGNATLNAVPADAARTLAREGRSPLTIEEGVSVLLQMAAILAAQSLLHDAGLTLRRPSRAGALAQRQAAEAGLVLGRKSTYVAGIRFLRLKNIGREAEWVSGLRD